MPLFPEYRIRDQSAVMALAGERTAVPVPRTLWQESGPEILGAAFFVMGRVEGVIPPDILPYTFGDNRLIDAIDDQRRLPRASTAEPVRRPRHPRASSGTGWGSEGCRLTGVITSICASDVRRGPDQRAGTASIR